MANKDYGTTLKKGSTVIGEIISVGVPEIKTDKAETTNHSSGGWRSYIPTGLKGLEEFELTLLAAGSIVSSIYTDMAAETVTAYTVAYSGSTSGSMGNWTFNAFPTSIKVEDMKADKPNTMQFKVKFQASGSLTMA